MKQKLKKKKKKKNEIVRFARRFAYDESAINLLFHLSFNFIQLTIDQTTTAKSIKTFSLSEKNSSSNSIDKKKNVFADLLNKIKYLDIFMFVFNNIITIVKFEKIILNKLSEKMKIKKSTIESINNRETKTSVIFFNETFFSLIQKSDFD